MKLSFIRAISPLFTKIEELWSFITPKKEKDDSLCKR